MTIYTQRTCGVCPPCAFEPPPPPPPPPPPFDKDLNLFRAVNLYRFYLPRYDSPANADPSRMTKEVVQWNNRVSGSTILTETYEVDKKSGTLLVKRTGTRRNENETEYFMAPFPEWWMGGLPDGDPAMQVGRRIWGPSNFDVQCVGYFTTGNQNCLRTGLLANPNTIQLASMIDGITTDMDWLTMSASPFEPVSGTLINEQGYFWKSGHAPNEFKEDAWPDAMGWQNPLADITRWPGFIQKTFPYLWASQARLPSAWYLEWDWDVPHRINQDTEGYDRAFDMRFPWQSVWHDRRVNLCDYCLVRGLHNLDGPGVAKHVHFYSLPGNSKNFGGGSYVRTYSFAAGGGMVVELRAPGYVLVTHGASATPPAPIGDL